jgi:ABC-type multidrug transport system fused ATPase/permease subunit
MQLGGHIKKLLKLSAELRKISESQIAGKDVILQFKMTAYEKERQEKAYAEYEAEYRSFALRSAFSAALFVLMLFCSLTAVIIAASTAVLDAELTPTGAVFLTTLVFAVFLFLGISRLRSLIRICKSSENPPEKTEKEITYGGINTATERNDIVFSGVSFSYPESNREVFSGLTFTVKNGERFAFLGRTGSGKTTAEKLIRRELDPDNGIITLGGISLSDYNYGLLQKKLGTLDFTASNAVSDVLDFDRIILLDDGAAADSGNHKKLLISSPLYRRMYEAEFGVNPYESMDKGADFDDFL